MKEYKLDNLSPVISFSENVFLDEGFVIAAQEMPMGESRFKALRAWGCDVVFSDGIPMEISEDESFKKNRQLGEEYFNNDDAHHRAAGLFSRLLSFVTVCFEKASKGQKALYDDVAIQIKEICTQMRDNKRYLLQVQQEYRAATDSSYLEAHAVRAAILSIAIGMLLKLPAHRLIELGVAALLHEIGMAKLPASISMSTKQFDEKEYKTLTLHPQLGYNILKDWHFPLAISVACLEHHERENGKGYPRSLEGNRISQYAKIIAVACSYESITADRPHKDARDGFIGVVDILKNTNKQYDNSIVKALVLSLSFYPIGSYVLLSNGKKGQVTDINPQDPRSPIVIIHGQGNSGVKFPIIETGKDGITVVRTLRKDEIEEAL